jgi:hypothetical protein
MRGEHGQVVEQFLRSSGALGQRALPRCLRLRENFAGGGFFAVGEGFLLDPEAVENAEENVGHLGVAVAPVLAVLEAHVGAASDEGREVFGQMRGAGAGAVEDDGVVEQVAFVFLVALEALEKVD